MAQTPLWCPPPPHLAFSLLLPFPFPCLYLCLLLPLACRQFSQ